MATDPARLLAQLAAPIVTGELFDFVPDTAFFLKDRAGRYIAVNQTLVERCGLRSKADLLGRTVVRYSPANSPRVMPSRIGSGSRTVKPSPTNSNSTATQAAAARRGGGIRAPQLRRVADPGNSRRARARWNALTSTRCLDAGGQKRVEVNALHPQIAVSPLSPVRICTISSSGETNTRPSPDLPVRAACTMAATTWSFIASVTANSIFTFGW